MRKSLLILLILILPITVLKSQSTQGTDISKNNLYLEFGTNIIITSANINYERQFFTSKAENINLYGRAGFGPAGVFWGSSGFGGLLAVTMITGKENHHFEAGGGLFLGYETAVFAGESGKFFPLPMLDLGYRYQKPVGGFLFRAKVGILSVGFGLGYSF